MSASQQAASLELGAAASELPGIEQMIDEVYSGPEVIRPSIFWERLIAQHVEWIQNTGFEDFKRTLNRHYFQFIPKSPFSSRRYRDDPMWPLYHAVALQFRAVLGGWLRRPNPRVLTARLTEEVPNYLKVHFNTPLSERRYAIYVAALWEQVRRLGGAELLDCLEEPTLGRPLAPRYRGKLISEDLCNSVLELTSICGGLPGGRPGAGGVVELGAGYGRLAWVFANAFPDTRYVIVDIPPALAVSQRYLSTLLPDRRIFRFRHFEDPDEVADELTAAQLAFLTPNQLDLISPLGAQLFITISSLQEMRPEQITHYLEQSVPRHSAGYFYLKQWERSVNTSDGVVISREDYRIPRDWSPVFDRAHPVQTAFFEAMYRLPGGLRS